MRASLAFAFAGTLLMGGLAVIGAAQAGTRPHGDAPSASTRVMPGLNLAQGRQCSQRAGPFATQDTAWARWRQARAQGYAVSNGVVPCWQGQHRTYCFFVFRPC